MADERSPRLVLLGDSGEVFDLPEGVTRIGRAPGNEMRLADTTVSRFHCQVVRSGREVRVEDTDSHNSTRVNGEQAGATLLHHGDVLRVGRLKLRYDDPESAAAKPPVEPPESAVKRDRPAARRRGPALFPLLSLLIAVLGLSWLFIASSFTARKPERESGVSSRDDRALSSELLETRRQLELQNARLEDVRSRFSDAQAALDALEKSYQRELAALRREYEDGKGEDRDKALYRQILSLESTIRELGEQRESDRQAFNAQLEDATRSLAAGESGGEPDAGSRSTSSRTAVSRLQPRAALSKKEVAGLVETLQRALGNYASVEATPETLEPALGALSGGDGDAAKGLLDVLRHARNLLEGIDENIAFLTRRTERLLAEAAAPNAATEDSGEKMERSSAGPELEKRQRELELSERKIAIKRLQRERLVALVDAARAAFGRMTDPDAVRHLLGVFARDRDVETRLAILGSLRASASPDAVPVLLGRFTAQDETVRKAVRATLIVIAGKDLGDNKEDWERWWAEQKA